jgi:hypothetical protein
MATTNYLRATSWLFNADGFVDAIFGYYGYDQSQRLLKKR